MSVANNSNCIQVDHRVQIFTWTSAKIRRCKFQALSWLFEKFSPSSQTGCWCWRWQRRPAGCWWQVLCSCQRHVETLTFNFLLSTSQLEQSLEKAEEKIAGLLQVKEKLVIVQVMGLQLSQSYFYPQIFSNYKIFRLGWEGEAGGRCEPPGGGAFCPSSGQQDPHGLHSHSHHR